MTGQLTELLIILILGGYIIVQAVIHQKERSELLNRLMARDLGEFRAFNEDGVKIGKSENFVQIAIKKAEAMSQERG